MRRPLKSRLKDFRILITLSRTATGDTALLTGLLLGVNMLLLPGDLGMTQLNPSPFLLVPLVIGGRYGMLAGLYSGLLISGMIGQGLRMSDLPVEFRNPETLYLITAPPIIGVICGEMFSILSRNYQREKARNTGLRRAQKAMDAEIRLMRFDTDENIRLGLLAQTGRIQLESDLKELLLLPLEQVPQAVLSLLRHHLLVREAALYSVRRGDPIIRRESLLGSNRNLPGEIDTREYPMIFQAVEIGRATSLALNDPVDAIVSRPHLIAAPLRNDDGDTFSVLIVADMPLTAFNRRAIRLVTLITNWAEDCLAAQTDGKPLYRLLPEGRNRRIKSEEVFRTRLDECIRLALRDRTPWQLCEVIRTDENLAAERFELTVMEGTRAEDVVYTDPGSPMRMLVIMPLANPNDAIRFEKRVTNNFARIGAIDGFEFVARSSINRDEAAALFRGTGTGPRDV